MNFRGFYLLTLNIHQQTITKTLSKFEYTKLYEEAEHFTLV